MHFSIVFSVSIPQIYKCTYWSLVNGDLIKYLSEHQVKQYNFWTPSPKKKNKTNQKTVSNFNIRNSQPFSRSGLCETRLM